MCICKFSFVCSCFLCFRFWYWINAIKCCVWFYKLPVLQNQWNYFGCVVCIGRMKIDFFRNLWKMTSIDSVNVSGLWRFSEIFEGAQIIVPISSCMCDIINWRHCFSSTTMRVVEFGHSQTRNSAKLAKTG